MNVQTLGDAPLHARGGQRSYLLLGSGRFDARHLAITWVDCAPGSQQLVHEHDAQEQVYVIIRGRGVMIVGDDEREVEAGTLVLMPPGTGHAIRNASGDAMSYVSATSPPFDDAMLGALYRPQR